MAHARTGWLLEPGRDGHRGGVQPRAAVWRAGSRIEGPGAVIVPLTSGNADLGRDIYRGCFRMSGVEVDGPGSALFDGTGGHPDWQEILHGFGWLEHLRATGRELGRVHARALISDWIGRKHKHHSAALASTVMARRLLSWIHHLPFYLEGAGDNFSHLLFRSMTRQVRVLQYRTAFHRRSAARLPMMLAVCHASVGLRGLEHLRAQNFGAMADLLAKSLYADGGHISRNPAELAGLLLDLLPLRKTCEEAGIQLPAKLHAAIERMLPMLRFFTHGDGGIALFQGSGDPLADSCHAIFSADPVAGRPVTHASHSGYARLAAGALTAIVDAGLPAPDAVNRRAALSPLAFEFSDRGNRVVINCGSPQFATREGLMAARLPEAHSTATLNVAPATSSGSIATWLSGWVRAVSRSPRQVEARIETSPVGMLFEGSHDAYLGSTGYLHSRSLFLSANGNDLRGEDHFQFRGARSGVDVPATIRFHLHPAVKATTSKDGKSIMLLLPSKAGWRFSVRGAELGLEDSISFGREGRHRATVQIVLRCFAGTAERVHWAFKRIERRQAAAQRPPEAPELPL